MSHEIELPSVAAGVEHATLMRWAKSEGDTVVKGETIAELETDKAVMEMEAEADGVVGRIIVPAGTENVSVGTVIGVLLDPGEDESVLADYPLRDTSEEDSADTTGAKAVVGVTPDVSDTPRSAEEAGGKRVFASPLARRLAGEHGVDLAEISGSGPHGRVVRIDVEKASGAIAQTQTEQEMDVASDDDSGVVRLPNDGMRKTIARRLCQSKQDIPHFYLRVDCRVDALLRLRSHLNDRGAKAQNAYRLSVNDMLVYAVAKAMNKVPEVNASWTDSETLRYQDVDISVAVATDRGLVTPIIRNADRKGMAQISGRIRELVDQAKTGGLAPADYEGGGFTISNLGMYGIREFAAIINPPQAAILAVGAVEQRPVVEDGELAVGNVMTLTLSADHRVIDGAVGARFLSELRILLEDPIQLLV